MDEYLSEKEQIEQIRNWWRDNGWYLVGGALVAGLGYLGYYQYQAYQDRRGEAAAALYLELQQSIEDDRPGVDELLEQLVSEYAGSPYTHQARLLIASERIVTAPERAIDELRTVMNGSADPGLAMIARLRLARALAYREQYDEALALLEVEEPGEFAARLNEIKGDVHAARGDVEAARAAYTAALTESGSEGLDQNFVRMKLNDLAGAEDGA